MQQQAFGIETMTDALRECVNHLGGPKEVGRKMRPELPMDQAANYVRDRVNPARRERFDPEQVLWLLREARQKGYHLAIEYITQECGYTTPQPLEPEDERAKLQREYIEATRQMAKIADRMERMQSAMHSLKSVA
jgi:hypothetical protein